MPDPRLPAAKRRLAVLLRDEEYGAKLARLGRADERVVLDLVYEGRGREARRAVLDLDEARRRHRSFRTYAKYYARLDTDDRTGQWHDAMDKSAGHEKEFWNLYRAAVLAAS